MTEILDNNNTGEMTVLKVYELAADAGRECQQLIERYGQDSASNVTLKIISILEHLELLVNEKTELEKNVARLSEDLVVCKSELSRRTEENINSQIDLHKLEEQHLQDLEEWKELLMKARKENKDLRRQLNEKEGQVIQEKVQEQETLKVLLKLKETVDKQRDQIRAKDNDVRSRNQDIEALQQQVERLAKVNTNLRRKQELVENHSRALIRQKSTLQVDVMTLNKSINRQKTIREADEADGKDNGNAQDEDEDGRMCFDSSDPNRPRFTLEELRKVLIERDEMHLKVLALEEELESYKSEEDQTVSPTNGSSPTPQGELSAKNKPSGIRKFFANLFKGNKGKTDVEEELKKWELIDFDSAELTPSSEVDPLNTSVSSDSATTRGSPHESHNTVPRRNSEGAQSLDNNNDSVSGKSESRLFGLKTRSTSSPKEMVEIKSPSGSSSSSPRKGSRSSSPTDLPSPRATPPPIKNRPRRNSDGDGANSDEGALAMLHPLDPMLQFIPPF